MGKSKRGNFMKYILGIALLIGLSGCSAEWHLRKAKEHIIKAEAKGAQWERQIKVDTVKVDTAIYVEGAGFASEFDFTDHDTVFVEKDKFITKVVVKTKEKKVYIETKVPADTITVHVKVPCETEINNSLQAGFSAWQVVGIGIFSGLLVFIIYTAYNWLRGRKSQPGKQA